MTLYIDTETTGLTHNDEIVEIAIIDDDRILLDTLVKPVNHDSWPQAQAIHGISPEEVANAPTYGELRQQVKALVTGQDVVIYNANYDSQYLHKELESAESVQCAMLRFAEVYGDWDDYRQSYAWQKLTTAARYVNHSWTGNAHRALSDAQATRSVWRYLTDPQEKARVDAFHQDKLYQHEASLALMEISLHREKIEDEKAVSTTRFLDIWWRKAYPFEHWSRDPHPVNRYRSTDELTEDTWSQIFFAKPAWLLSIEDVASQIYRSKKDIPNHLVAESYFKQYGTWFTRLIRPSDAAYIGKKTGWILYDISEIERIREIHPLRLADIKLQDGERLITKTQARKLKISLTGLSPVKEVQTGYGDWYFLYKVKIPQESALLC